MSKSAKRRKTGDFVQDLVREGDKERTPASFGEEKDKNYEVGKEG